MMSWATACTSSFSPRGPRKSECGEGEGGRKQVSGMAKMQLHPNHKPKSILESQSFPGRPPPHPVAHPRPRGRVPGGALGFGGALLSGFIAGISASSARTSAAHPGGFSLSPILLSRSAHWTSSSEKETHIDINIDDSPSCYQQVHTPIQVTS
jgi:hypothetical protein